jgi:hypothetical protein
MERTLTHSPGISGSQTILKSCEQKPKRQSVQSIESLHPIGQPNSHHFFLRMMEGTVGGEEERVKLVGVRRVVTGIGKRRGIAVMLVVVVRRSTRILLRVGTLIFDRL